MSWAERFLAKWFIGGDPEVAFAIDSGTEVIFVVIAGDFPAIANGLKDICRSVVIGILDSGEFPALSRVNPSVMFQEAQWLGQSLSPGSQNGFFRIAVGVFQNENISCACSDEKGSVPESCHGADFHGDGFRKLKGFN